MKKVLILGGTKFVGLELVRRLQSAPDCSIHVGSRREIAGVYFIHLDRKSEDDLTRVFENHAYDVVVDFINYSGTDGSVFLNALEHSGQTPHVVCISTVYVYGAPVDVSAGHTYDEDDFDAHAYPPVMKDRPEVDYTEGKRSAEAVMAQRYPREKTSTLRFPIILGADDYTRRTHFFHDLIRDKKSVRLADTSGQANYICAPEAASSIEYFIKSELPGTYNVAMEPPLTERELFDVFRSGMDVSGGAGTQADGEVTRSPFFYPHDYRVRTDRLKNHYTFAETFPNALTRELHAMECRS